MKRNKQRIVYSPTVYGLYSNVAKRFNFPSWLTPSAGGETWHVEGGKDKLVNKGGQPSTITKKDLQDQRDNYFSPILGAGQRWKSSMNNGTNPVKGLLRTVVPAVGTAAALYYSPTIVSNASKIIPKVAKTVAAHPKLSAQIGKRVAVKTGIDFASGIVGGNAVNNLTNMFTDNKNWGEFAAPYLGVSNDLADWTNPGYAIGPGMVTKFIHPKINEIFDAKRDLVGIKSKINYFNKKLEENKNIEKDLNQQLINAKYLRENLYEKFNGSLSKILGLQDCVRKMSPVDQIYRKQQYMHNRKLFNMVQSDNFPTSLSEFNLHIPKDTKLGINNLDSKNTYPLIFTDQNQKEFKSTLNIFPRNISDITFRDQDLRVFPDKGKVVAYPIINMPINGERFGKVFKNNATEVQQGISNYVDNLNNLMGEDGAVAGSLIHYKNGIFPATEHGVDLIGPADTEIYTTQNRLPSLIDKLQFKKSTTNSVEGYKGISPHTFRGDSEHNGIDTEINIINQDASGNATGKLSHQIYRALYPENYSKLMKGHALSPTTEESFSETSLPISAEDLFQEVNRNPNSMQQHLLTDMVGMETFTNRNHIKASKRLFSTLFNDSGNIPELLNNALRTHGRYNLGSNFKQATELYPNMALNNKDSNINFLKNVYNLTDEEANKFASNPQVMANAVNLYDFQNSVGVRLVGRDVVTDVANNGQQWHNPEIELFTGNGSFGGGNLSGGGLNRALLNPAGGWHFNKQRGDKPMDLVSVTQAPLTLYPEKIKTPLDIFNQVDRLKNTDRQFDMEAPYLVSNFDKSKPLEYDNKTIQYIQDLAKQKDIPVNFSMGQYDYGYSGSYVPPISAGARRSSYNDTHELGSLLKDIQERAKKTYPVHTNDSQYIQEELNKASENVKNIENTWKNSTVAQRYQNINYGNGYKDGNITADVDYPYKDIYNIHNSQYVNKLRELRQTVGLNNKEYFEGINNYIKDYKNLKQQLNDAVHERAQINHQHHLAHRQYNRLYDQTNETNKTNNLLERNVDENDNILNQLKWNTKFNKRDLRDAGILSGTILGTLQGMNYAVNDGNNRLINFNNEVADEKWGYSNPRKGNYFLDQNQNYIDQGYSNKQAFKLATEDENKAIQLYDKQ